jgi:hypothetical protein
MRHAGFQPDKLSQAGGLGRLRNWVRQTGSIAGDIGFKASHRHPRALGGHTFAGQALGRY